VSFAPASVEGGGPHETILASAAGRARILDVRPTIIPIWCAYDGVWSGPQHEIILDLDDRWAVLLGALDDIAVKDGDFVSEGQRLGTLSSSTCNGNRALEMVLWQREPEGVRSHPFGSLGAYQDTQLVPGFEVVGGR
jgi:hypothetical protein